LNYVYGEKRILSFIPVSKQTTLEFNIDFYLFIRFHKFCLALNSYEKKKLFNKKYKYLFRIK